MTPIQPTKPFDLDDTQKTVTTALINLLTLSFGPKEKALDPEAGANLGKSIQAEIRRMRDELTNVRDNHRPKPHADPNQPGALCATCSLDGALTTWPCQPWTTADRILTHGQP